MTEQLPLGLDPEANKLETEKLETRKRYLALLAEKLKDPEFRAIEGFPLAEDEAILALSDPPYYTACPNPFLPEIIEQWQQARVSSAELASDESKNEIIPNSQLATDQLETYHREPFAADVSEGKNDPIYNAHSYHTKVPHKAIMRYILHYTEPGDIVFDGFCGTGMTGVAAQLCGDKKTVESLGYHVTDDGLCIPLDELAGYELASNESKRKKTRHSPPDNSKPGTQYPKLGARRAVLGDLSPAATFIAYSYNTPVDVKAFEKKANRILREVEAECGWMYETLHTDGKTKGRINYTVWSDTFLCPTCGYEINYWNSAFDADKGKLQEEFVCPSCQTLVSKRNLERAWEIRWDEVLNSTIRYPKQAPVIIHYLVGKKRFEKTPDESDLATIQEIQNKSIPYKYPTARMMFRDGIWGDEWRKGRHEWITHSHHFYLQRNLWVLAALWSKCQSSTQQLKLVFQSMAVTLCSRMTRYNLGNRGNGPISGTLYIGSAIAEANVLKLFAGKAKDFARAFRKLGSNQQLVTCQSTSNLSQIHSETIDYIFVDPPFGDNLMYSELNFLWEGWYAVFTNNNSEAVVSKTQEKGLFRYQQLMQDCFREAFRLLKPGRWMTIEFHNSKNNVWNAIQEATLRAGFVIADVRTLDKKQGSFKQVTATGSVKQDLVISAYKPRTDFEQQFLAEGGREKGAWEFVRQHLEQLPVLVEKGGSLEVVAERQAYLLYDRMVAFHIQRGFSVPLSAAEFYAGLKQRFPERDGMYFLSTQAAEYDQRRLKVQRVEQLALFVTDEKSAIQWLQRELDSDTGSGPQTYQDLQPKFLRELHQARHEKLPELRDLLEENFLQDDQERWFVPNPERQEHLEQLRERSLLREFQEYATAKGRLKLFRTEAVRAGFKRAWADKQYRLIVQVAQRLPDSVLQEDPGLLMYYDNALMRAEKAPG